MTPATTQIDAQDTARLIPSKYSPDEASVLTRIADDDAHLSVIFALDDVANDRLRAAADQLTGISANELVTHVPYASVINAAFCHAGPTGARFNGPDRGAWYASLQVATSLAEVSFHHALALQQTGTFHDSITYDTYLADMCGTYHDLRHDDFKDCLLPDDYRPAQALAADLLAKQATGVIYPSVRGPGDCIACFHPKQVENVRKSTRYRLTWAGSPEPETTIEA